MSKGLSAQMAHQDFHVTTVIAEQNRQPDQDPHGIGRKQASLEHSNRMTEQLSEFADKVDQAIDDPLVPPHGNPGKDAGQRGRAVDAQAVDDSGVEKSERGAEVLDAIDENRVVEFIDVVLVVQKLVQARPGGGDLGVQMRKLQVQTVGQPDTETGNGNGDRHQEIFDDPGIVRELNRAGLRDDPAYHRFQELLEVALGSPESREGDPSADDGEELEDGERDGHGFGRFVDVMLHFVGDARETEEGKVEKPEHVEGGQAGREYANDPEGQVTVEHCRAGDRASQDFVFAEETGERRHAGNGQRGDEERTRGGRNGVPQAAHFAQILLTGKRMNHATGAEEEQGLEESVSHEVENASSKGAYAEGEKHEPQLTDRGIGQDFLDVGLRKSHGCGENSGEGADDGDDVHGRRGELIDGVHAGDHIDTRGDHRGGMDEGADGRGTLHRIGEPDVQGQLRGLAGCTNEEEQSDRGEYGRAIGEAALVHHGGQHFENAGEAPGIAETPRGESNGAKGGGNEENPEEEARVADTINDEGFFASVRSGFFEEVETDQQVAAKTDALPTHEKKQEIVGEDEGKHREHEQVEISEEAVVAAFAAHVADGVDVDK